MVHGARCIVRSAVAARGVWCMVCRRFAVQFRCIVQLRSAAYGAQCDYSVWCVVKSGGQCVVSPRCTVRGAVTEYGA
eukprot:9656498-Lingulodinium_polyedra.AAC.1